MQDVGQAVDGDRLQAGIAEDHLVQRLAGRVAVVGGLHVQGQNLPQVGQLFEKLDRLGLAEGLELAGLPRIALALLDRLVPQRPADLHGQRVVQPVDQIAHVIGDVAQVQAVAAAVAGIEDFLEVLGGRDDRLVVGQRAVAQVADPPHFGIRVDDPLRQHRAGFL